MRHTQITEIGGAARAGLGLGAHALLFTLQLFIFTDVSLAQLHIYDQDPGFGRARMRTGCLGRRKSL